AGHLSAAQVRSSQLKGLTACLISSVAEALVHRPRRTIAAVTSYSRIFKEAYRRACTVGLFFFSSRRRHTRFSRDWSSDVCSSDLVNSQFGSESSTTLKPARAADVAIISYSVARRVLPSGYQNLTSTGPVTPASASRALAPSMSTSAKSAEPFASMIGSYDGEPGICRIESRVTAFGFSGLMSLSTIS